MVARARLLAILKKALARSRVVILTGPSQCGKPTLAWQLINETSVNHFDLEDPADLVRLAEPMTALGPLRGSSSSMRCNAGLIFSRFCASWRI